MCSPCRWRQRSSWVLPARSAKARWKQRVTRHWQVPTSSQVSSSFQAKLNSKLFQKMHPSIATVKSIRLVFGRPVRAWPHGVGIPMNVQSPEFWGLPWGKPTWISNMCGYPRKNINTPENVDLHRCSISIFYIYIYTVYIIISIYLLCSHYRWYLIVGYSISSPDFGGQPPDFWWLWPCTIFRRLKPLLIGISSDLGYNDCG